MPEFKKSKGFKMKGPMFFKSALKKYGKAPMKDMHGDAPMKDYSVDKGSHEHPHSPAKHRIDANAEVRKDALDYNAELPSHQKKSTESIKKKYPPKMAFHTDEMEGHTHGATDKGNVKTIDKEGNVKAVEKGAKKSAVKKHKKYKK